MYIKFTLKSYKLMQSSSGMMMYEFSRFNKFSENKYITREINK